MDLGLDYIKLNYITFTLGLIPPFRQFDSGAMY